MRLGYSDSGPRQRGEAPSWRPSDQSAERKVGLPSDPAVVADRRRQFGGWEWPGTILPTDSIVVLTDFDRIARLHIGGEPLVMCYGSQRQRSAPQGQRSLWPSHGLLQALATNGKDAPSVRMRHRHRPPTGPHERFLRKRSSESGWQLEPPACAIAQDGASGAARRRACLWAIAQATNYSARPRSGRPLIGEAIVREGCAGRGGDLSARGAGFDACFHAEASARK